MTVTLVGRLVLEELDVRAVAHPQDGDLVDHGARVDAEQILHQRPLRVGDRAERERCTRAEDVLEPGDGLADIRDREPDMVGADQAELALHTAKGGARAGEREERRAGNGARAQVEEVLAITAKLRHDTLRVDAPNVASLSRRRAVVDVPEAA